MALSDEIEALNPTPSTIQLAGGVEAEIVPMDTIQLIYLLKIFTNGSPSQQLAEMMFSLDPEDESFVPRLVMNLLMAIPNAADEVLEFLRSMLRPKGLKKGRNLSKADREANVDLIEKFNEAIVNPRGVDTIRILSGIITDSGDELKNMGKLITDLYKQITKSHLPASE